MKIKLSLMLLLLSSLSVKVSAQQVTFNQVKEQYESFEYSKVIQLSTTLLRQGEISDSLKIETYLMRVVSFYTLGDEPSTQNSFREILKINRNFIPDRSRISPRLISIFESVKTEYLKSLTPDGELKDSLQIRPVSEISMKGSMLKNVFIPGWGQVSSDNHLKGYLLTAASTINLGAMIYYIFDTNKKENAYLNETNKSLIASKYDQFDKSYKTRNTLIVSYVIIWVYSQIDLLLFDSSDNGDEPLRENKLSIYNSGRDLRLDLKIPINF